MFSIYHQSRTTALQSQLQLQPHSFGAYLHIDILLMFAYGSLT